MKQLLPMAITIVLLVTALKGLSFFELVVIVLLCVPITYIGVGAWHHAKKLRELEH